MINWHQYSDNTLYTWLLYVYGIPSYMNNVSWCWIIWAKNRGLCKIPPSLAFILFKLFVLSICWCLSKLKWQIQLFSFQMAIKWPIDQFFLSALLTFLKWEKSTIWAFLLLFTNLLLLLKWYSVKTKDTLDSLNWTIWHQTI